MTRLVVMEYSGKGLPLAEWTERHPGAVADMIFEPFRDVGGQRQAPGMLLATNVRKNAFTELETLLATTYAPSKGLHVSRVAGEWMGRITLHAQRMAVNPAAVAAARQAPALGAPWSHVEQGIIYMHLRPQGSLDAEKAAAGLRAELDRQGVTDAQVTTQELDVRQHGVWDRLVQAAVGLHD